MKKTTKLTYAESTRLADLFRDVAMNGRYYGERLKRAKTSARRIASWLALLAAWSVFSRQFLGSTAGQIFANVLCFTVATLLSQTPFVDDRQEQERFRVLKIYYGAMLDRLELLIAELKNGVAPRDKIEEIRAVIAAFQSLDDPAPNHDLLAASQVAVNRRYPVTYFRWPMADAA